MLEGALIKSEVELNFVYLFSNDAKFLIKKASEEETKLKSLYVRYAIIAAIFTAEAFINRVFEDFYIAGSFSKIEQSFKLTEKWMVAPLTCRLNGNETFDRSCNPFQSFVELVKIRNWFVHPKVGQYVPAVLDKNSIITVEDKRKVPWVETLNGEVWPCTQIPKNPFEFTEEHAEKAINIVNDMIREIQCFMPDKVTHYWIKKIEFKSGDEIKEFSDLTTDSLWGGYTP